MKGKTLLVSLALLLVAVSVLPAQPAAAKGDYHYDFEKLMKPWQTGSFMMVSASKAGKTSGDNGCLDGGNNYAGLTFKPITISGGDVLGPEISAPSLSAMWIAATFPLQGDEIVHVQWAARAAKDCAGCTPIVYVGTKPPTRANQFTAIEPDPEIDPFVKGDWRNLEYTAKVTGDGVVFVALGMRVPLSRFPEGTPKSQIRYAGLDCIDVQIYPEQ